MSDDSRLRDFLGIVAAPIAVALLLRLVFFDNRLVAVGIMSGALIGVAGSATSVWRHLRRL